jgi:hypothetical protein
MTTTSYAFDPTGQLPANLVTGEQHILTMQNYRDYHFIVPTYAPYFSDSVIMTIVDTNNNSRRLYEGVDYTCTHNFLGASRSCTKPIYGSLSINDLTLAGIVTLQYQTLGGNWVLNLAQIMQILSDRIHNPRITAWEMVTGYPTIFPPIDHEWNLVDMVGMTEVVAALAGISDALSTSLLTGWQAHILASNPHNTTAHDVDAYTRAEVDAMFAALGIDGADQLYHLLGR